MRALIQSSRNLLGAGGLVLLLAGCASSPPDTSSPEAGAENSARAPAEAVTGSRIARRDNKMINTQTLNKDAVREAADAVQGAATGSSGTR